MDWRETAKAKHEASAGSTAFASLNHDNGDRSGQRHRGDEKLDNGSSAQLSSAGGLEYNTRNEEYLVVLTCRWLRGRGPRW